jgi:hypothetical protein
VQVHAGHIVELDEALNDPMGPLLDVLIDIGPLLRSARRMINRLATWEAHAHSDTASA